MTQDGVSVLWWYAKCKSSQSGSMNIQNNSTFFFSGNSYLHPLIKPYSFHRITELWRQEFAIFLIFSYPEAISKHFFILAPMNFLPYRWCSYLLAFSMFLQRHVCFGVYIHRVLKLELCKEACEGIISALMLLCQYLFHNALPISVSKPNTQNQDLFYFGWSGFLFETFKLQIAEVIHSVAMPQFAFLRNILHNSVRTQYVFG